MLTICPPEAQYVRASAAMLKGRLLDGSTTPHLGIRSQAGPLQFMIETVIGQSENSSRCYTTPDCQAVHNKIIPQML